MEFSSGNAGNAGNLLATALRDAGNAGNAGKPERITSGLRVEIRTRTLSDGKISYHGAFRERGKERKYVGYISTEEVWKYKEAIANYRRNNRRKNAGNAGNAPGDTGGVEQIASIASGTGEPVRPG